MGEGSNEQRKEEEEWKERGSWGEMQGEGTLLVGFGSEGADLKELRVGFNCGRGLEKRRRTGGHGSKMLGREGVTHIDRSSFYTDNWSKGEGRKITCVVIFRKIYKKQ